MDRKHLCELKLYFDCVRFVSYMHLRRPDSYKLASVTRSPLRLYIQRVCLCLCVSVASLEFYCKVNLRSPETMGAHAFFGRGTCRTFLPRSHSLFCDCDATAPLLVAAAADFVCFGLLGAAGAAQNNPLTHTHAPCCVQE